MVAGAEMTTTVKHAKQSGLPADDGSSSHVRPSDWYADHTIEGAPSDDGWVTATETWTYASADDPTYTFTISGDYTSKYQAGMKIKWTQTSVRYAIITKVAFASGTTTVTLYGGTDYDLDNAAISSPYYSTARSPFGFPMDPAKWTVSVAYGGGGQSSAVVDTYYNKSSITIPIGVWDFWARYYHGADGTTGAQCQLQSGISTANNSLSDVALLAYLTAYIFTNTAQITETVFLRKQLNLSAKATYYLNIVSRQNAGTTRIFIGDGCLLEAVCAYL